MIHAFVLVVMLEGKTVSNDLYFRSLTECLWYSVRIARQSPAISSHCLPKLIDPNKVKVY